VDERNHIAVIELCVLQPFNRADQTDTSSDRRSINGHHIDSDVVATSPIPSDRRGIRGVQPRSFIIR
jgi:hypothetical protein